MRLPISEEFHTVSAESSVFAHLMIGVKFRLKAILDVCVCTFED